MRLVGYFWGPFAWLIEAAALLSLYTRDYTDFFIILGILFANAGIGFWQEHQAENTIEQLKERLAIDTRVLRDGKWRDSPAAELVPGDIVRAHLGDIIPADIKLAEGEQLLVDESALTGESLPVRKHKGDVVYTSSIVRQGEMDAMVIATGTNTYYGKTASLVETAVTESHFQHALGRIAEFLIIADVALVAIILILAVIRNQDFMQTMQFAMVLTIASIPVALPMVLSVTMAIGARNLSNKAIVSKLLAIDEMAGLDVLCADKTGTMTKNELTIASVQPLGSCSVNEVLLAAGLASREEDKDPIDDAILARVRQEAEISDTVNNRRVIKFTPFDPVTKRTEAVISGDGQPEYQVAKGAAQAIIELLPDRDEAEASINEYVDQLAAQGYRSLAVAKTGASGEWSCSGILALYDPPREDTAETIKTAEAMGLDVKMVTGDHMAIARQIAPEVNLGDDFLLPDAFTDIPEAEAEQIVEDADGFAQVFPEHKYRIVELLQEEGHILGMTGDGVNDAPALKKADAGFAVTGATNAAKSAAAVVLVKPGLSVIIDAIKEARRVFQRMTNYAIYRISATIWVLVFIALSIIVYQFYPISALMVMLLALLNDIPLGTISMDHVQVSPKPVQWSMRSLLVIATILGSIGVIQSFGALYLGKNYFDLTTDELQSYIYLMLSVGGHLSVFVARTRGPFWSVRPSLLLFLAVVITQLIATTLCVFGLLVPAIGGRLAAFVWMYAFGFFLLTDVVKLGAYRVMGRVGIS